MTRRSSVETQTQSVADGRSTRSKGSTLHLQRWMTQLPETEEMDPPEPDLETWSIEELRKRSQELNLLEVADLVANNAKISPMEHKANEKSPSKSSNSGSQITVRTSPVVVDTIPVCRQCHKKCLSKPNSPLVSQKEPILPKKEPSHPSPQTSLSNKSSKSDCSTNCDGRIPKHFAYHLERKNAMKLRPEDPHAALKVIDSIAESQKMLKSTSYDLKTDSPLLNRHVSRSSSNKSHLEQRHNSIRSPSPVTSSRNNSPLSTSRTTCSSIVFNSSSNDLRTSNSNINNQIQCVVTQEKYLNEVKCVENIILNNSKSKNNNSGTLTREQMTKERAEHALNKVLSMNVIAKRETYGSCMKTSAIFLDDEATDNEKDIKFQSKMRRSPKMGISAVSKMNGDINRKTENNEDCNSYKKTNNHTDEDVELMLMGLSAFSPASHLVRVDPFKRPITSNSTSSRPGSLSSLKSESPVPNIAIVPPTPDFNSANKTDGVVDDSPESPDLPEEPPYVTLKRYGTLSSLERFPSDETDDGSVRVETDASKNFNQTNPSGGIMGWTARAGSFVVEKMNIFSYTESAPNTTLLQKQPSFLERCLGVSDWKPVFGAEDGTGEGGEGSGASGEEAWGTPSSGDLSDNLADSEHGTLSSPTKSSSSYAGDDDTELMMDELLMAPTITGPTTLRPLLPRRRLEPLLEEECSDSGSEDNKPTPTNPDQKGSVGGLSADVYCNAPRQLLSTYVTGAGGFRVAAAQHQPTQEFACGTASDQNVSPDRTPTNEVPLMLLQSVSKECADVRAGAAGGAGAAGVAAGGRRGSASSASTPSTLDRTTIHNPSTPQHDPARTASEPATVEPLSDLQKKPSTPPEERLSPRAEMRLALDQGKDMLADQEVSWAGVSDPWSFRVACQRSLLRRVASADAVIHIAPPTPRASRPAHRTAPHTTSHSSVYAWKAPDNEKPMEMEQLARAEVQTMHSQTPSQCQNGKILGFLRRRASSDSPRREPFMVNPRPFSPRRSTEKQFDKRFWKQVTKRRQSFGAVSQI